MKKPLCLLMITRVLCASPDSCNGSGNIGDDGDFFDGDRSALNFEGATLTVSASAPFFEALMNLYLFDEAKVNYLDVTFTADAERNSGTTLRSNYDGMRDALQATLEQLCQKFSKLE